MHSKNNLYNSLYSIYKYYKVWYNKNIMKKILLTGSKGIIGSNILPYLKTKGHNVISIDSDIRDYNTLRSEILKHKDADWLIHLGAIVSTISCDLAGRHSFDVNVTGTYNVAELCKEFGIKFCYFSTTAIYKPGQNPILEESIKEPQTLYGFTKYLGEITAQFVFKDKQNDLLVVRPCFAFGGNNDRSIGSLLVESAYKNKPLNVQLDPKNKKDYLWIEELSSAIELLLKNNNSGDYNISYGKPVDFQELVDKTTEIVGNKPFLYFREELDYMKDHCVDNSKVKTVIDWKPNITVENGMKIILEKLKKENGDIK